MRTQDSMPHRERQERAYRNRTGRRPARPRTKRPEAAQGMAAPAAKEFPWTKIVLGLLLIFLVLQVMSLIHAMQLRKDTERELQEHVDQLVEPESCEVRYLIPNRPDIVEQVSYGEDSSLHAPVELDGYTFLGWEDADGVMETRSTIPVYRDLLYTARYALKLETEEHLPYLQADKNGVVDVDGIVSRREFVRILYKLLNIKRVGEGVFLDVGKKDPCYKAAATLKDLGILEGNYLYPDDSLTCLELLQTLERFYPRSTETFEFPELDPDGEAYSVFCTAAAYGWIEPDEAPDPSAFISRGEFAHIVNRVLGRGSGQRPARSLVGTILDVPPSHQYYADIAEAVIPHQYEITDSGETWTDSEPLPPHEPGLFFAGVRLHLIRPSGATALNVTVDGRTFNHNGEITTGDAELDLQLWEIMEEVIDPASMTDEEMLLALYNYVCDNFSPAFDTLYEVGAEGWAVKEAKRLLSAGEGSSYGYSALFYELAYLSGFKPTLISGIIYGQQTEFEAEDGTRIEAPQGHIPHAWVEISFDGISYIFDPAGESRVDSNRLYFKRNNPIRWQRGYRDKLW